MDFREYLMTLDKEQLLSAVRYYSSKIDLVNYLIKVPSKSITTVDDMKEYIEMWIKR